MHRKEDILDFAGFEGCASDREFWWHLAADNEAQWGRFPGAHSWQWTPPDECEVRPFDGEALVKDMVEKGGWLLIGDSVTENHFFSLSCVLFPHVRATPNYTENPYFDRAWPQNLYLSPTSPLLRHLALPPGFDIEKTPLVTFRRVDLLLDRPELEALYAELYPSGAEADGEALRLPSKPLFSDEQFWSMSPREYVREIFLQPAPLRYSTLVISTAGHWTTTLMSGFADPAQPGDGIAGVLGFFGVSMQRWAEEVQGMMDGYREEEERRSGRWFGLGRRGGVERQVVIRAYLPGHEDCHDERRPWTEWKSFRWNWYNWGSIKDFNRIFEETLSSPAFPDIHYLPIDRPALLRPDAHSAGDCLHIMTGAGVLEGWTHYIWHYVTREVPGRIR
ncbi:uncharacterized protein LAESUDRAFT_658093 [Laetiporus sulphureus 93-53]|uniref:Uncharacterized protein n=1 Tax=Laetiporus sulphureus 93-53 TaxID=1314785 RepID=A0A165D986_9APHY|nr:uncharacterized protein LAESUDRAFT_658093 [Laetiporus sulphureus 93-53]KZT04371.1 hypothetical protein LAESUDRAFT_658093 [Laetiporus sulphureus 93-53]